NVVVSGEFDGVLDLGSGPLPSAGGGDAFVAKFDTGGVHLWSKSFGGPGRDHGRSVAIDGAGAIVMAGYFQGDVDFGGGALSSAGGKDIFVVKIDSAGSVLWAKRFGSTGDDYVRGVAVDSMNNIVVTGRFEGTVDFGTASLQSAGDRDIFLAKL